MSIRVLLVHAYSFPPGRMAAAGDHPMGLESMPEDLQGCGVGRQMKKVRIDQEGCLPRAHAGLLETHPSSTWTVNQSLRTTAGWSCSGNLANIFLMGLNGLLHPRNPMG